MKNLIFAFATILISGQLHASIECEDGTFAFDCDDHGGPAVSSETEVVNEGAEVGDAASDDDERVSVTVLPEVVVTARADHSRLCDRNTVITINTYLNQERPRYGHQACIFNKQAAEGRIAYSALPNRVGPQISEEDFQNASGMKAVDCETACPATAVAAQPAPANAAPAVAGDEPLLTDNQTARYMRGGGTGEMASTGAGPARCLADAYATIQCDVTQMCGSENDQTLKSDQCHRSQVPAQAGQPARPFVHFKPLTAQEGVDFESINSCQTFFGQGAPGGGQTTTYTFDLRNVDQVGTRLCRLVAASCPTNTAAHRSGYANCVRSKAAQEMRAVVVGMKKCAAIKAAGNATTEFEGGSKMSSIDGKITCKSHSGQAFDYPSCKSFVTWYNTLTATQSGVQMYNEGSKISTGMRAQREAADAISSGQGQEAGVEASRKTIMASASAEERNKLFFIAKGTAITTQLLSFVTRDNIDGKCDGEDQSCCELFNEDKRNDAIKSANAFFPNSGEKDKMIAEVIKAGGEAALAAMREQELKRQAAALKAIKDQMTAPDDIVDEGLMRFCLQFPQDSKCLGPGNRVISGGSGFKGPSFSGQNMGLGNLGTATSEEINVEDGAASAIGGPQNSIGDIGSADKGAADAKATFDAPSALKGGGGAATISGGGGAGANASANGLSNDPGVEGDKKETPLKMTSKSASYEGGAGYNGGGYRAGAGGKKDEATNPFASMFGKDKGRSPSAVPEIDSPASDLFTKISNRYGEVQKRKALMEVR